MSDGKFINEISVLSRDIQDIDNQIIRLQLKRDGLAAKRDDLRKKQKKLESEGDIRSFELGMKMTMDMLGREVGLDRLIE